MRLACSYQLVAWGNMAGFRASLWVFLSLFSWVCLSDCQLRSWLIYNLSACSFVYRNASQNEDPYYNRYLFAAQNQTRPQGIKTTGNPLYGIGMAQNQPPLHYPAMLNSYMIYQNPIPGTSNHLQFERDSESASPSPSPSESSNRGEDRTKRSSWSFTEEKCLIAAYKEYYDRLKSTKSSQGRKSIWEDTLKLFQSMCFDNGVDSEKSLVQLKEKWINTKVYVTTTITQEGNGIHT